MISQLNTLLSFTYREMRITISIAIILLSIQCSTVVCKHNSERKNKDKKLQTVKYQEHRDVSLLYGTTKNSEDSSKPTVNHLNGDNQTDIPRIKMSRYPKRHHVTHQLRFSKGYAVHEKNLSDHGVINKAVNTHGSVFQNQDSKEAASNAKIRHPNSATLRKRKTPSIKGLTDEISPSIKKHEIPNSRVYHTLTKTRKRTRVEEALSTEKQNIAKTIDTLDDLPGSYSRGIDMDGMDITEVNMIDNNTLSDYFHALNGNVSDSNNNIDNGNDVSMSSSTTSSSTPKLSWDESSSETEESNSGNDDFYEAIDNGDAIPPIKMKKVRPTKSHFHKLKSNSNKDASSVSQNPSSTSQHPFFREPSQQDFENFFRGMLDHFGHERKHDQPEEQGKNYELSHHEKQNDQNNVSAFLDGHDGHRHGNVTKLVSLGSPERVEVTQQMQQHNMGSGVDTNRLFSKDKETEREGEGEGMASFLPQTSPISWMERQPGDNSKPPSQEGPPGNFRSPPFTAHMSMPLQQSVKQVHFNSERQQDATSPSIPFKGTRIMGGKISGGQISGGVIQGGQIKAGLIEGGVIKGGQVVGGRIINGTMEGGVVANGQMLGGHLVNGRIEGGQLLGGNVFGGKILGGSVEGGDMKGGVIAGGRFRGGSMQGGLLKGGEIQSGTIKGGKVEGGVLHGGNIEGGEFKFGDISGGTLKSGTMLGGVLKNGSIEGGTLKGGTIEGGVLKGGVMEGGQLKGGLVLAGKIKGGVIEGGVIEGGEIGDGVLITGGKVNASIIGTGSSFDKSQKLGGLFKQGENSQQLGLKINPQKYHHGSNKAIHGEKAMSDLLPSPQASTHTPQHNTGFKEMHPNVNLDVPLREGTLKMLPQENDSSEDDSLEKLLMGGKSADDNTPEPELSSQRFFEEQEQPSRVVQKKGGKHHVVVDGVGFDLPNEDFIDLIDKMKNEDLINYYKQPDTKEDSNIRHMSTPTKSVTSSEKENEHIKPEDLEKKLSFPTKPRSSVTHSDKDKSVHDDRKESSTSRSSSVKLKKMKAVKLKPGDSERCKLSLLYLRL